MLEPVPFRDIVFGQVSLVACCLVYLAWWCVAFRPGVAAGGRLGYALLAVTMVLAGVGMSLDIAGLRALWYGAAGRAELRILLAGVLAYPLLLLVTVKWFHRVPTTELLLIVAWAVLETLVVTVLVLAGLAADGAALPCALAIVFATVVGLACYLVYYRLAPWPAFVCGMVPLGIDALAMMFVTWRLVP
ncbi:hypothetical protein [uncultured Selenomonas sp.]|uniref:hypothetical protein n=1 Tax=uncultured Selenomonas sp. TaxID=159275 RepID=UPI0025E43178|nr:hypothetical protein [uncultured Selenomonas sp.]